MVMPANNTCWVVHAWAAWYPGTIGHLYTPHRAEQAFPHIPYALDCGTYSFREDPDAWPAEKFERLLDWACVQCRPPEWVVVPDVVFHWARTLERWAEWRDRVAAYGWPLAIAVQNGATASEVAALKPDVVFVGGDTKWKWATVADWTANFARVHVGRVNWPTQLQLCKAAGVESCDGTGWFRGDVEQIAHLETFLRCEAGRFDPPLVANASRRGASRGSGQRAMFTMEEAV